jgi:hypothetical protein
VLRSTEYGPITRIHLARTFLGRPLYTVEAYLVDGLLIDTGCPATASELVAWCRLLACAHAGLVEDARGAIERKLAYWECLVKGVKQLQLVPTPVLGCTL